MAEKKECPLCGKLVNEDEILCDDCQNHVDNQYTTDLLNPDDELGSENQITNVLETPDTASSIHDEENKVSEKEETGKTVKKGKSLIGKVFLFVGCILVVVIGVIGSIKVMEYRKSVENENNYWNACVDENTQLAYSKYLVAFPEGRYAEEADRRILELKEAEVSAWTKLKGSSDINDYYAYLSENPASPYLEQARFLMDSLSWIAALQDDTEYAYKAYLENVKLGNLSGDHIAEAEERFSYLSQIISLEGNALDSIKSELNLFFKALSENNSMQLLRQIAPRAYYYSKKEDTNTAIVSKIDKDFPGKNIRSIKYTPQSKSIRAKKDNKNIVFVDLSLDKEIVFNTKIKKGKVTEYKKQKTTDILKMEIDSERMIRLIELSKK